MMLCLVRGGPAKGGRDASAMRYRNEQSRVLLPRRHPDRGALRQRAEGDHRTQPVGWLVRRGAVGWGAPPPPHPRHPRQAGEPTDAVKVGRAARAPCQRVLWDNLAWGFFIFKKISKGLVPFLRDGFCVCSSRGKDLYRCNK